MKKKLEKLQNETLKNLKAPNEAFEFST